MLLPGVLIPRIFEREGTKYVIENGVGRDMLKAGLVTVVEGASSPEHEMFRLESLGYQYVVSHFGIPRLVDLGILDPEIEVEGPQKQPGVS